MVALFVCIGIVGFIMIISPFIYKFIKQDKNNNNKDYNKKKETENYNKQETANSKYIIKNKYISYCELEFYEAIKNILNEKYIIFPQVPLSQIVTKQPETIWHTELFRIIDLCIFSKDYKPLVCIEINDETHHEKNRYLRDKKVQNILNEAKLPLITLWVNFGVKPDYIKRRLQEHIII